jgi:hypothetical protein
MKERKYNLSAGTYDLKDNSSKSFKIDRNRERKIIEPILYLEYGI